MIYLRQLGCRWSIRFMLKRQKGGNWAPALQKNTAPGWYGAVVEAMKIGLKVEFNG